MSAPMACLSPQQLTELARDQLSPQRCAELEEHLSRCESCRQLLEAYDDGSPWLAEVQMALAVEAECDSSGFFAEHDSQKDIDATLHGILPLLGPTDDPCMMGRIGPYEIVGVLGRGGMGIVFKGFDPALNRYVAVKMLLPHLAATGAARKRFAREAQAAAAVVNDHVMAIHSVAEWQGLPFLVMPYGRGESLQKRLHDRGALELPEILRISMQTAKGLAAAHAQGLVHRDVKPANILLSEGVDRVALTDFGLARAVDDIGLTREGVLAGTPQYMSPEQARGQPVDSRSDLFSLGCVLYIMCTGVAPFRAESSLAVLRHVTDSQPQRIRALNPSIPAWLELIVGKLLAKDPEERYQSADEVAELLERCLAHTQQPLIVPLPMDVQAKLPASSRPRRWGRLAALSAGLAAACVLFGMGSLYLATKPRAVREPPSAVASNDERFSPANSETNAVADGWDALQSEFDAVDAELKELEHAFREESSEEAHESSHDESLSPEPVLDPKS